MCGLFHTMIESLKRLGLSETESNIYLQLIKKHKTLTNSQLVKPTQSVKIDELFT